MYSLNYYKLKTHYKLIDHTLNTKTNIWKFCPHNIGFNRSLKLIFFSFLSDGTCGNKGVVLVLQSYKMWIIDTGTMKIDRLLFEVSKTKCDLQDFGFVIEIFILHM